MEAGNRTVESNQNSKSDMSLKYYAVFLESLRYCYKPPHNRPMFFLQENIALNCLLLAIDSLGSNVTITVLVSVCLHMPEHVCLYFHLVSLKRILNVRF